MISHARRFAALTLATASLLALVGRAAESRLLSIAPSEAVAVVHIPNFPQAKEAWLKSPYARAWSDPQIAGFLAPLREQMADDDWKAKLREETGMSPQEIVDLLTGEAAAAISLPEGDLEGAEPVVTLAFEIGKNGAAVETLLGKGVEEEKGEKATVEEFQGEKLHLVTRRVEPVEGEETPAEEKEVRAWSVVGEVLLLSPNKDSLQRGVAAFKTADRAASIAATAGWQRMTQRSPDSQLALYFNFESLFPKLLELVKRQMAESGRDPLAQVGTNPEMVMSALGLDALQSLHLTVTVREKWTEMDSGLRYSQLKGLVKLFLHGEGAAAQPEFLPAQFASASSMRFSLKTFFQTLKEIVTAASPALGGMAQGYLQNSTQFLGFNVETDFFGSFGPDAFSGYSLPEDAQGKVSMSRAYQVFGFSLANRDALDGALGALRQKYPQMDQMLTQRDYLGTTIFSFQPPARAPRPEDAPSNEVHYAVAPSHLLFAIGSAAPLEAVLQGMQEKRGSIWEKPEAAAALDSLPGGALAIGVTDYPVLLAGLAEMAAEFQRKSEASAAAQPTEDMPEAPSTAANKRMVDPSAVPGASVFARYLRHSAQTNHRESDGFFGTARIFHAE